MGPNYKKGDLALLEGQVVEITDVRIGTSREFDWFRYRIKLNGMVAWINEVELKPIDQKTAQTLFGKV